MNKIIESDEIELGEWFEFSNGVRGTSPDEITVAFAPKKTGHTAIIRIGIDIMKQMKWKDGDRLIMLLNKNDRYKWALVLASKGYKIASDDNVKTNKRISLTWPHSGVTFTKAKTCRYEIDREKLIIHIPM